MGTGNSMAGGPAASCSREGVPRTSERKTWQVIWELDAKGERLGIKNDHFPEIKTKTSHQFLPCTTEDVGLPICISIMINSLIHFPIQVSLHWLLRYLSEGKGRSFVYRVI